MNPLPKEQQGERSIHTDIDLQEITSLLQRLKPYHPVQHAMKALLNGAPPSVEPFWQALEKPSCFLWREQQVAAWALGYVVQSPEEKRGSADRLGNLLKRTQWPDVGRWMWQRFLQVGGTLILTIGMRYVLAPPLDRYLDGIIGVVAVGTFLSLFIIPIWCATAAHSRFYRLQTMAATSLGRLRVPESVNVLLATLEACLSWAGTGRSPQVRMATLQALHEVVPMLTGEHYGALPAHTVPNLCWALGQADEVLVMKVLHALEQIGDGRAVVPVERVARKAKPLSIRQEAERILPVLRARREQESAPATLLRAANVSEQTPETLLRPVSGLGEEKSEQLLRSSCGQGED